MGHRPHRWGHGQVDAGLPSPFSRSSAGGRSMLRTWAGGGRAGSRPSSPRVERPPHGVLGTTALSGDCSGSCILCDGMLRRSGAGGPTVVCLSIPLHPRVALGHGLRGRGLSSGGAGQGHQDSLPPRGVARSICFHPFSSK